MLERKEYPRPQLRRDDWFTLNGVWQFEYDDENIGIRESFFNGKKEFSKQINVPFSYQYSASGIGDESYHPVLWYKRTFCLTEKQIKRNALLCFNAVDYECDVWVNGIHVCSHKGGFTPFKKDISNVLKKENVIVVRCYDPLDPTIPRGKQSWINDRFACWYVPNSGIWQSVWVEFFDKDCLDKYTLLTDIDNCSIYGEIVTLNQVADEVEFAISYNQREIKRCSFNTDGKYTKFEIKLMDLDFVDESFLWTPEKPNLFYIDITLKAKSQCLDLVHTRFGMRKISIGEDGAILLNNKPLYQRLILDQGYFPESGITPPSCESLKRDIQLSIDMGFNGARKHQKIEDPYFYYYADEMGFLTTCEMPSAYNFNKDEQTYLMTEWLNIISDVCNFTSIIMYVPLNESWGVRKILTDDDMQNFARSLYYITKSMDNTRLVSTNDGWENVNPTDVISVHDYAFDDADFEKKYNSESWDLIYPQSRRLMAMGNYYDGQPVLFSEFGGIAMQYTSGDNAWGYNTKAATNDEFYARYKKLFDGVYKMPFYGFCYTQLTDVQQEINGLLDENHNPKFDIEIIKKLTLGKNN